MNEDEFRSRDDRGKTEPAFDYMAEADKTCSIVFGTHQVDRDGIVLVLGEVAHACERLNLYKKLLFRGKTPEQLGMMLPRMSESLAVEFDPNNTPQPDIDLLHGIVGAITEAGEMAEVLLHRIKTGEFDRVNAIEEVGDMSWYLARQLRGMNADFDMSNRMNIDKLHGRHGAAFDVFRDANRDLVAERAALEVAAAPLLSGMAGHDAEGMPIAPPASAAEQDAGYEDRPDSARNVAKAPAPHYGPCEGDDVHNSPEPGLYWSGGCWRREIKRDIPGLAV